MKPTFLVIGAVLVLILQALLSLSLGRPLAYSTPLDMVQVYRKSCRLERLAEQTPANYVSAWSNKSVKLILSVKIEFKQTTSHFLAWISNLTNTFVKITYNKNAEGRRQLQVRVDDNR